MQFFCRIDPARGLLVRHDGCDPALDVGVDAKVNGDV